MLNPRSPNRKFCGVVREFHISRQSRTRYELDDNLFSLSGNVIFANFRAARLLAQRIPRAHPVDLPGHHQRPDGAGQT